MILLKRLAAVLIVAAALPYLFTPVYRFPPPQKFHGPGLFNPYANTSGRWRVANLHAHGRAWSGVTNGRQSDADVVRAYKQRGYDIAGISDYQWIAANHGVPTIPIYEHGYNISKHHQLAIGAHRVDWFDFPLWQGVSQTQYVIDRVKQSADLVAIVHPMTAYDDDDFTKLTGYQLLEVANGPFLGDTLWDAALSSGHPVWAIADDDTHDVTDPKRMAVAWNVIDAASDSADDIVAALRQGRSYAVSAPNGRRVPAESTLTRFEVRGSTVSVESSGGPATFSFVGQNGVVRKKVEWTTSATYDATPDDTYVRTEIRTPNTTMFLNPVIRYDGVSLPTPVASLNRAGMWAQRVLVAVPCLAIVPILWRRGVTDASAR